MTNSHAPLYTDCLSFVEAIPIIRSMLLLLLCLSSSKCIHYYQERIERREHAMLRQLNFLLLLKLSFTPTRMWHHVKSIKREPCRPGSQTRMHHHITPQRATYKHMHSAHQFSTESAHSWQRLGLWWHRWWLQVTCKLTIACRLLLTVQIGTF